MALVCGDRLAQREKKALLVRLGSGKPGLSEGRQFCLQVVVSGETQLAARWLVSGSAGARTTGVPL